MITQCPKCTRGFDDEFRSTICPHETFAANDGKNRFAHHPESFLSPAGSVKPESIAAAWESYRLDLLYDAPPVQIQETRRAFYAGAAALLGVQQNMATTLSDDDAVEGMEALVQELVEFVARVGKDR